MSKRIAVVGSGVSGLVAAATLSSRYHVDLYESEPRLGGHTATIDVSVPEGDYAIDTGFIVFNNRNYPRFKGLIDKLGLAYQPTEMSFSVTDPVDGWVFNGHTPNSIFCDRRNLVKPAFYRFLLEIARFNKVAKARLATGEPIDLSLTVGDLLREEGFSDTVARKYLLPMGAAIWSSSLADVRDYPLAFFLAFFNNHGLLDLSNRPQWYTLIGGSSSYIPHFQSQVSGETRVGSAVTRVVRDSAGVRIDTAAGEGEHYDDVVLACHSDQALAMLDNPTDAEARVLGAIPYSENRVILHRDESALPRKPLARASWNYRLGADESTAPAVTYSMNILQCLPEGAPPFSVTLNPNHPIDDDKILGEYRYAHPQFGVGMIDAQAKRSDICGVDRVHFCGAYWYNGFHEDGVRSALDVCERLGCAA